MFSSVKNSEAPERPLWSHPFCTVIQLKIETNNRNKLHFRDLKILIEDWPEILEQRADQS